MEKKVMGNVYQVKQGDSPWSFTKAALGPSATNADIAKQVAKLPSIYGCKSMEEFQRKYFSKSGASIEIKFGSSSTKRNTNTASTLKRNPSLTQRYDSAAPCDAIPDSGRLIEKRYPESLTNKAISAKGGGLVYIPQQQN